MAALCALIGTFWSTRSDAPEYFTGSHAALTVWGQLVAATGMKELHATQPKHAAQLALLVAGRAATPHLWTDAWLAALALSQDCEMVTFDRGFRSFPGLALKLLDA